jgi:membrane-bound acyltransferase YfiQ involved in biofilm formation
MRKLIAVICLTAFVALQYGKVISYWHCRLAAVTVTCDCEKTLLDHHSEKDHPTPLMIAKEKAAEVFLVHEVAAFKPTLVPITTINRSVGQSLFPADPARTIFQPPRA